LSAKNTIERYAYCTRSIRALTIVDSKVLACLKTQTAADTLPAAALMIVFGQIVTYSGTIS
jgi:hypothetical protein